MGVESMRSPSVRKDSYRCGTRPVKLYAKNPPPRGWGIWEIPEVRSGESGGGLRLLSRGACAEEEEGGGLGGGGNGDVDALAGEGSPKVFSTVPVGTVPPTP